MRRHAVIHAGIVTLLAGLAVLGAVRVLMPSVVGKPGAALVGARAALSDGVQQLVNGHHALAPLRATRDPVSAPVMPPARHAEK